MSILSSWRKWLKRNDHSRRMPTTRLRLEYLEDRTVPSTIQGTVFSDANGNGLLDSGEPGLAGWSVFVDLNRDSVLDSGEPSAVTAADGTYNIDTSAYPPEPGWYQYLALDLQQGTGGRWLNTTPTFAVVDPVAEPSAVGRNFGVRFQPFVGVAPSGPETLVNATTNGQQGGLSANESGSPVSVSTDAAGNSVVAWRTFVPGGPDIISARVFNADGTPKTGELTVGSVTPNSWPQMPQTAMAAVDGRFAVAWSSYNATVQSSSTFVRVYDANGNPVSGPVTVIQGTSKTSSSLEGMAMNANGDFAVMYNKATNNGSGFGGSASVMIQRYTKLGAVNGQVINVVTPNLVNGERSLAMDSVGNFVAVWDDSIRSSGQNFTLGVYAQRYNANGQKNGSLITVATLLPNSNVIWKSSVAMAHDGRFAVAWQNRVNHQAPDGSAYSDYICGAKLFNAAGSPVVALGEVTRSNAIEAPLGIAYDDAGNVTFAYTDDRSPKLGTSYLYDRGEVRFRRCTASGTLEPEMIVNTTTQGGQFRPGVAATGNGRFIVAWQGYGPGDNVGIFAQRFSSAPHIGSFTASSSSVTAGDPVTLTAADVQALSPGSTITQVAFYVDSNNNGILDPGDTLLMGTSTQSNGTWTLTFPTTGWASGSHKLFARAVDSYGVFSDPLALNLDVL